MEQVGRAVRVRQEAEECQEESRTAMAAGMSQGWLSNRVGPQRWTNVPAVTGSGTRHCF